MGNTDSRSEVRPELQRDASNTTVPLESNMYVMRLSDLLQLQVLEPQQVLLAKGKVVLWTPAMRKVFFFSHQWTSWQHPDHTGEQFRTMSRMLTRMLTGEMGEVAPGFTERVYLPSGVAMTGKQWQELLADGEVYIWLECAAGPPLARHATISLVPVLACVR